MSSFKICTYESMEHGGLIKFWLGHLLFTLILNPVDLKEVLRTCLEKDDIRKFVNNFLGDGIVFAPVSIWRERREIMLPALAPKVVAGFIDVFADQSRTLADKLEVSCGVGKFEVWPYIYSYSFGSVFETLLAINIETENESDVSFIDLVNRAMNLVSERIFHLWYQPDWLYKLFRSKYLEHEDCRHKLNKFADEIIARKRQEVSDGFNKQTLLDMLIKLSNEKKAYNNIELREELLSVLVAGTDTSSLVIATTLILLGKYPNIQEKVHQELSDVFQDSDRRLSREDLARVNYLERVIKESLRLFPPAPFLIRKVENEVKLPSGHILPAGSGVVINVWGTHRDPKAWGPDAESFDPDRFLPDRYDLPHPCSFIPFLSGPRNCLGTQYAMMSMKAALTAILRRFKVIGIPEEGPVPQIRMKMDVMMKAVEGYNISLERKVNVKV